MNRLTKEQSAVVSDIIENRNVIVLGGAGTGKTQILIETVAHKAMIHGESESIAFLTFTRKNSREIRKHLNSFLTKKKKPKFMGFSGTINDLAYCNLPKNIYVIKNSKYKRKEFINQNFSKLDHIPTDVLFSKQFPEIIHEWEAFKKSNNIAELDDLILISQPNSRQFKTIIIDGFEEISPKQLTFIKKFTCRNIVFLGDPLQSIYSFPGTISNTCEIIKKNYQEIFTHRLTKNFRCNPKITRLANSIIRKNQNRKKIISTQNSAQLPKLYIFEDIFDKLKLIKNIRSDIILVRTDHLKKELNKYLLKTKIATIYSVKGLEFKSVTLFLEDFPQSNNNFKEEISLLYVGITRAIDKLLILVPESKSRLDLFKTLSKYCKVQYHNRINSFLKNTY